MAKCANILTVTFLLSTRCVSLLACWLSVNLELEGDLKMTLCSLHCVIITDNYEDNSRI